VIETKRILFCVLILMKIRKVGKMIAKKKKLLAFPTDTNSVGKTVGIFQ